MTPSLLFLFRIELFPLFVRTTSCWAPPTRLTLTLAVLGSVLLVPRTARASCGHYVLIGGEKPAAMRHESQPPASTESHPVQPPIRPPRTRPTGPGQPDRLPAPPRLRAPAHYRAVGRLSRPAERPPTGRL